MLALMSLMVGLILSLAMLRSGSAQMKSETSRVKTRAAANIAEAGIDYAYYRVHYKDADLPYSATVNLGSGTFNVTATDDGTRSPSTMLITSTGTSGSTQTTIKRDVLGILPYHYAWSENSNRVTDRVINCTGQEGMRVNGLVNLNSFANWVTAGVRATGSISYHGTVTPRYPNSPPIMFPNIIYSRYSALATRVYPDNTTLVNVASSAVILVNGRLNIRGTYWGMVTVMATGKITINGSLSYGNASSYIILMSPVGIDVQSAAANIDCMLYSHSDDGGNFVPGSGTGTINLYGAKNITGIIAADSVTLDSNVTISRYSSVTLPFMRQLYMPGT